MELIEVDVEELKPHPENPRRHPEKSIEKLVRSIEAFGFTNPILVQPDRTMIAGHARLKAAKKAGLETVPVLELDLEGEDAEAYMIADNRLNEETGWDRERLANLVQDLEAEAENLRELEVTGLDPEELDELLEPPGDFDPEDVPEGTAPEEPETSPGDLIKLGDHRLLCGDSTWPDHVEALAGDVKADCIFTDPPYNLAGESEILAAQAIRETYAELKGSEWDKNFEPEAFLENALEVLAEDAAVYICMSQYMAPAVFEWYDEWTDFYNYCVWCKTNPTPSLSKRHWTWSTELIGYGVRGDHYFRPQVDTHELNYWEIPARAHDTEHPTEKPIDLTAKAVGRSCPREGTVFDFFTGSGTTLLAAEQLGRTFYGLEIDPHFCDLTIERWENVTGKTASRESVL